MILIGGFGSPFVRRVATTMKLYGIDYEHRALRGTDPDQRIEAKFVIPVDNFLRSVGERLVGHGIGEGVTAIYRTQHGPAHAQNGAAEKIEGQFLGIDGAFHQAVRSLTDTEYLPAIPFNRPKRDGADRCVETGAVAAAC